jgi:hypothetical protein
MTTVSTSPSAVDRGRPGRRPQGHRVHRAAAARLGRCPRPSSSAGAGCCKVKHVPEQLLDVTITR